MILHYIQAALLGIFPVVASDSIETEASRPELGLPRLSEFQYEAPQPGSYALPVIKGAGDGRVVDCDGREGSLKDYTQGRITVLSFIYTRCAAARACPYATGVLNQLHGISAKEAELGKGMRLVSLSFDPEHDTPERFRAYRSWAGSREGACEWEFLTTRSARELEPILEWYGQAVDRKADEADTQGPLSHTLRVLLLDREGRVRNIYGADTLDPRLVMSDIRTLLRE